MKLPPLPPGLYEGADAAWVLVALVVACALGVLAVAVAIAARRLAVRGERRVVSRTGGVTS